jgi:molybdopterin-containing oxidoreductase family iron-sulfur binding subunit
LNESKEPYSENIYHLYVKNNWEKNIFPSLTLSVGFRNFWYGSLHDGIATYKESIPEENQFQLDSFSADDVSKPGEDFVVLLKDSQFIGDGRFANNGWLQELPHPVTKIVWDNYASVSPDTAKSLGVEMGSNVKISTNGKTITLPALIQPGMADKVVSIELGYGRTNAGIIGNGIGFDAINLISIDRQLTDWLYNDGKVTKSSGSHELVSTQEHYLIDDERYKDIQIKRNIIQEGTYDKYKEKSDFLKIHDEKEVQMGNFPSINKEHEYTGVKWAMAIDLNKCIGCSDCVAACNVENNIPVVGKDEVKRTREMHWIRIDRYYSGTPQEPNASFQPILCQQCDFAPCENVCPVKATTHTNDGLNGMTYNRCVGTRYCSNNCPYKVRRFNYFHYRDDYKDSFYLSDSFSLLHNPEVTIRSRGVMEKCTFCLQRIMKARQVATQDNKELNGSDVITACQDACGANAIVFGDMNNKESELQNYRDHNLSYHVLEELKIKPNITYIAKLRNTIEKNLEEKH